MKVVEVETPLAHQKLKDVSMKVVEDMHAQNSDGFDDEMKICNLANAKNAREWAKP